MIDEKLFLNQYVTIKKKYYKEHITLHNFFNDKTNLYPVNILIRGGYVFFFVKTTEYFKSKKFLKPMRAKVNNKVIIIRKEKTLIKLILGFFPDTYVHQITLDQDCTGKIFINLHFIFYEDRGIAIGRRGEYIKLVNEIFKEDIEKEYPYDFEIRCNYCELQSKILNNSSYL